MNVLFFKYVIEVERTRSISQAAENLFMAQPNLSKAIKEMEDTLGFNIFERSSKGVIPTMQGKEFLVYARNIVSQLEKIESIAKPNSAEPVSYTHLDVYKRQGYSDFFYDFLNFIMRKNIVAYKKCNKINSKTVHCQNRHIQYLSCAKNRYKEQQYNR